jgi:hypothetical protein
MLDAAKIRVCTVVDTHVPHWSACRDTALPFRLAPEEKLLACRHSFSDLSEVDPLLCRGLCAQMTRSLALAAHRFLLFSTGSVGNQSKGKVTEDFSVASHACCRSIRERFNNELLVES